MQSKKTAVLPVNPCSVRYDKSQVVSYENPDFPASIQMLRFPEAVRFSVTDHWHDELEFIYVKEGTILYIVEGETLELNGGQGAFVNSRKLHVVSEKKGCHAVFYCVIFHPMLLSASSYVDEKYVEPIIHNKNLTYIFFDQKIKWQAQVLDLIEQVYKSLKDSEGREHNIAALKLQMYFFDIWQNIYMNVGAYEQKPVRTGHNLSILKDMISYIYQHYSEKITLEDIAYAGNVGKTKCTSIFNRYTNRTPVDFLKEYRVQQSAVLLSTTDMSITEICFETGFASASYFGRTFRECYGLTPSEYRSRNS